MWHSVGSVTEAYDTIVYENQIPGTINILNAGPGTFKALSWFSLDSMANRNSPDATLELRPGDQRLICGALIRLQFFTKKK